jgi:hypothetical protein
MTAQLPGFCADLERRIDALKRSIPVNVYGLLHDGSPQECVDCYRKIMAEAHALNRFINEHPHISSGLTIGLKERALEEISMLCGIVLKYIPVFTSDVPAFIAGAPAEDTDENLIGVAKEAISFVTHTIISHFHAKAKKIIRRVQNLRFVQCQSGFRLEPLGETISVPNVSCDGNCVCGGDPITYWCGNASDARSALTAITANPSTDLCAQRVREVLTMILN